MACHAVDGKNGRMEQINASGAGLVSVTTIVHLEHTTGAVRPSKTEDFVSWTGAFKTIEGWTAPRSRGGFQVRSFGGQLQVKPGWKASCVSYSRYSGQDGTSGSYRHEISGFTCFEALGPSAEWTDGLADNFLVCALRRLGVGTGFDWTPSMPDPRVVRDGTNLIFAIEQKPKKPGFFSRLFGR